MIHSFILILMMLIMPSFITSISFDDQGIPEGSWRTTCRNYSYDKNTKRLTAECKTTYEHFNKASETNQYTNSTLTIDNPNDIKDIQNNNGWLVAIMHEGGNYILPEGNYKKECKNCEILVTNDESGNRVTCVRCTCKVKDAKGNVAEETKMVCHPNLLTLPDAIVLQAGGIVLNSKYLPGGEYLKSCTQCRIDLEFHRADAKAANGLQLSCLCPSTTSKQYKTYVRITDIREFLEAAKTFSNKAGILTQD